MERNFKLKCIFYFSKNTLFVVLFLCNQTIVPMGKRHIPYTLYTIHAFVKVVGVIGFVQLFSAKESRNKGCQMIGS